MKRRKFIKYSGILVGGSSLLASCHSSPKSPKQTELKAFIVSDAHIGWKHKDQPNIEQQRQSVSQIVRAFPDLDLAFDTGDAHHGYLNEAERKIARTQWLENIANQFSKTPFHYIPGNHELGKGEDDPEIVAADFGSIPFRPYYSFDCMGIHFISLPELLSTIIITQESINWLKLDLQINQEKTTIILSHNSIKGTTFNNGETGYRCLANSDELMGILDKNSQIIGWFHGHNHQYEIVKLKDKIYISNGRIGGFNPPQQWGEFGQGHLGGIYFEISASQFTIKAYSASKKDYLSKLGFKNLSLTLDVKTSFNPNLGFNYYCGNGKTSNNIQYEINNHYPIEDHPILVYQKTQDVINENAGISYPSQYYFASKSIDKIIGYKLQQKEIKFNLENNSMNLFNPKLLTSFALLFPTFKNKKHNLYRRGGYYHCAWQQKYSLKVVTSELLTSKKSLALSIDLLGYRYQIIKTFQPFGQEVSGNVAIFNFDTGDKIGKSSQLYLTFKLQFKHFPEKFTLKEIKLLPLKQDSNQISYFKYDGNEYEINPQLHPQTLKLTQLNQLSNQIEFNHLDDQMMAWLIKYPQAKWQIRNGKGYYENGILKLKTHGSQYHYIKEMIISPTTQMAFYLNRVLNIDALDLKYDGIDRLTIALHNLNEEQVLIFISTKKIKKVKGGRLIKAGVNQFKIKPINKIIEVSV